MLSRRLLIGGLSVLGAGAARAEPSPVQIYAAMTFRAALNDVLSAYRGIGGVAVAVYSPTPVLVRQLAQGASADILLTADKGWMDRAVDQKLVRPETRIDLLGNDLVLIAPAGSPVAGEIGRDFPLDAMLGAGKLAMCEPDHDPAGLYARDSLQALGLWSVAESHIAITETSLAAVTLVDRGEARAGICFATDVHGDSRAVIVGRFPSDSHQPLLYPAALTSNAPSPQAAEALAFLRSSRAFRIFEQFGYRHAP